MADDGHVPAPPARSWRVVSGTAVPLIVGSGGHIAAGGRWAAPPIVAVAVLLLGPVWVLSRREIGLLGIATLVASGQLITHAALMFGSATAGSGMAGTGVPTGSAFAFHLLAALVAGWWMRRGERRVWACARRVATAVCRCVCHLARGATHVGANGVPAVMIPAVEIGGHRDRLALRHAIVLRAPPSLA